MESISSLSMEPVFKFSFFQNRCRYLSPAVFRTSSRQSVVFLANRLMDLVMIISIVPRSQAATIDNSPSRFSSSCQRCLRHSKVRKFPLVIGFDIVLIVGLLRCQADKLFLTGCRHPAVGSHSDFLLSKGMHSPQSL